LRNRLLGGRVKFPTGVGEAAVELRLFPRSWEWWVFIRSGGVWAQQAQQGNKLGRSGTCAPAAPALRRPPARLVASVSGIVMPSALAVLRLMTNSILVTCCTGGRRAFRPLAREKRKSPGVNRGFNRWVNALDRVMISRAIPEGVFLGATDSRLSRQKESSLGHLGRYTSAARS
jgi:hypothetical protein